MIKKNIGLNNTNTNSNTNTNTNKKIETSSFLKTVESSEIDNISISNNLKDKQVDEIVSKYLDLKKKINLFWNKID